MKKENLAILLYYIKKVTTMGSTAELTGEELADLLTLTTSINEIDAQFEIYDSDHSECYVELYTDIVRTDDEEEYEVISKSANKFRAFKDDRQISIDEVINDIEKILEIGIYTIEDKYEHKMIYASADFDDIMNYVELHYFDDELFNADYAIFLYDDTTFKEYAECWNVKFNKGPNEFGLVHEMY